MAIFLNTELQPAQAGLKLLQAAVVEITSITGLTATDVQAALVELAARGTTGSGQAGLLSDVLRDLLADLNNADAHADAYTTIQTSQIATANAEATSNLSAFSNRQITIPAASGRYIVDLPDRFDTHGVLLGEFASGTSTTVLKVFDISASTDLGARPNKVRRYVTQALTGLTVGNQLRVLYRNNLYDFRTTAANTTVVAQNGVSGADVQEALEAVQASITALDTPEASDVSITTLTDVTATNVQEALTALLMLINAIDVPANASEVSTTIQNGVTKTDVQAELEALHTEIDAIDTSGGGGTGLTDRQLDILANINNTAATVGEYFDVQGGLLGVANTATPPTSAAFTNPYVTIAAADARYLIEIPALLDLRGVALVEYISSDPTDANPPISERRTIHSVSAATKVAGAGAGDQRYLVTALTSPTLTRTLRLQFRSDLYNFRTQATATMVTVQNGVGISGQPSLNTVQSELERLRVEINSIDGVPDEEQRVFQNIISSDSGAGWTNVANIQLAYPLTDSSETPTTFSNAPLTGTAGVSLWIRTLTGTSLAGRSLRWYSSATESNSTLLGSVLLTSNKVESISTTSTTHDFYRVNAISYPANARFAVQDAPVTYVNEPDVKIYAGLRSPSDSDFVVPPAVATSNFFPFLRFDVPAGTNLRGLFVRVYTSASAGGNENSGTLRESRELFGNVRTNTGAGTGRERWMLLTSITVRSGDRIQLQRPAGGVTYTLSSNFRVPQSTVTDLTAATVPSTASGNLVATNVQAALNELQTEIDGIDTSGTGLDASQTRKLAAIAEASVSGFEDLPNSRLAYHPVSAGAGTITDFMDQPLTGQAQSATATLHRIYFEVPKGTDLSGLFLRVYASDGTLIESRALSTANTQVTSIPPQTATLDRYRTTGAGVTTRATDLVRLQRVAVVGGNTFTLSNRYSVPFARVTDADSQKRALANITEASSNTYALIALAQIADGSSDTPGNFGQQVAGSQLSVRWFVEIPTTTPVGNVYLVRRNGDVVDAEFPLASEPIVAGANPGRVRYRTRENIAVALNQTLQIQTRTVNYDTYTLSDKYRLSATGLVGLLKENQLDASVRARLTKAEVDTFFDHVELHGTLSNTANLATFYYLPASSVPQRTLSSWTAVTNSRVPQPTLTTATSYAILLPEGSFPNGITWSPDPTQPTAPPEGPSTTRVTSSGFQRIPGNQVPEGYEGFTFVMPPWNAASTARTGARLSVGSLMPENVSRIDLDSTIKVTDNNVDFNGPTTVLTAAQVEKIDNLQLKTFNQQRFTIGKPNAHYELLLASAWPDPDIDYTAPGRITLGQDPGVTGVREVNDDAEFFNLISQANVTLGTPTPATSPATWIGQSEVVHDYAGCSGLIGGSIQATDNKTTPTMRVDDDNGVFAVMTIHISHFLAAGSYEILNIGNASANAANGLILVKDSQDRLTLSYRAFTGLPNSTTRQQDVRQQLGASNGAVSQLFRIPPGHTGASLNDVKGWVIPTNLTASSASPIRLQWFIRVWNNNNDEGIHDFTSSVPAAFRSLSSKAAIAELTFTLNFTSAGFTAGPSQVSCSMRLRAATGNNLPEIFFRMTLTNAAIAYEVTAFATTTQTVTIPQGSTRDLPFTNLPTFSRGDRDLEVGLYIRSQTHPGSSTRTLRYQAAVNGQVSGISDSTEPTPTGAVPVTFGVANNSIAVNRFTIFRPTRAGFDTATMQALTTKALRNRPIVGGLVRQAGGTYQEVFSPAYKLANYVTATAINLPGGTVMYPTWSVTGDIPPELSVRSDATVLLANTNFVGLVNISFNIQINNSGATSGFASRSLILVDAGLQQRLAGSNTWTDVPGPRHYEEIVQGNLRPTNRPELGTTTHPQIRRGFTTSVSFTSGASYRLDITGYRLTSGGAAWPTADNLVTVPAGSTYMQITIFPSV